MQRKLYCLVQYKIKYNFHLLFIHFLNKCILPMTGIHGSAQKHSTRSQFRAMPIHIYLYICQVAVSGTWLEAVNSSEARL